MFDREYELSKLVSFVSEKIEPELVSLDTYISTDNMLVDKGGVETATKLPTAPRFNHFKSGDTLFSNIRTYFKKVWLADFEGGASADVLIFRTNDAEVLDPNYLYFLLSSEGFINYTVLTAKGAKMPRGDKTAIMKYKFVLPQLEKQREIGLRLLNINKKIKLNRQTNQTLEQMARVIFKSWFVDFEPVKAKIAALEAGGSEDDALLAAMTAISGKNNAELEQFKSILPEQYEKLKSTAELFPSDMQDSELGEIPDGWEVQKIGEAVTAVGGGTPSTKNPDFWDGGNINWTTPRDLSSLQDKVLTETSRKITEQGLTKISSRLLPVDTVLMSSRAPVGYLALAKIPVAINQGYIAMKCDKVLTPEYVIQWCSASMEEIKGRAGGTTFAEISRTSFREIPVIVPSQGVITNYSNTVKNIYELITKNVLQSKTLAEVRDTLLPRLLSGEIDVSVITD